jgi:hypothetical protein
VDPEAEGEACVNKLCCNYPALALASPGGKTADGRTFDCRITQGWGVYSDTRIQLHEVELPDTLGDCTTDEDRERFQRARDCLTLALLGEKAFQEPLKEGAPGRTCVVAPHKFNRYNRAYVRCYLQTARVNVLHSFLSFKVARIAFLDVNRLMFHLAARRYDLNEAREILDSFEIMDLTFV